MAAAALMTGRSSGKVALFVKSDEWGRKAAALVRQHVEGALMVFPGDFGMPLPAEAGQDWDVIISFLAPWILPAAMLEQSRLAVNFHPGSREYPGIGCYNFALYDGAGEFGAVCHHMAARVDTGPIIFERRFPVLAADSVHSLRTRTVTVMLDMLVEFLGMLLRGDVPGGGELQWLRHPYTRKELNDLARISVDMPPEEIRRRVWAMHYPNRPGASIELAGIRFEAVLAEK